MFHSSYIKDHFWMGLETTGEKTFYKLYQLWQGNACCLSRCCTSRPVNSIYLLYFLWFLLLRILFSFRSLLPLLLGLTFKFWQKNKQGNGRNECVSQLFRLVGICQCLLAVICGVPCISYDEVNCFYWSNSHLNVKM